MTTQTLKSAAHFATEGRFEDAKALAEQRVRRAPNDPQGWLVLAEVTDDPDYALRCMERVVRLRPHDQRALQKMHDLAARLEDHEMGTLYDQLEGAKAARAAVPAGANVLNLLGAGAAGTVLGIIATLSTLTLMSMFG